MVARARLLLLTAVLFGNTLATADEKTTTTTACTATSTSSGAFFDLRPDIAMAPKEGSKHKRGPSADYTARGYDYGYNFTLNFCEPVVKPVDQVVGLDKALWKNISAYYEKDGKTYSLGQQSSVIKPRGNQLVLQYSGGSPCGSSSDKSKRGAVRAGANYRSYDDAEEDVETTSSTRTDDEIETSRAKTSSKSRSSGAVHKMNTVNIKKDETRRKSATFAFRCDRESIQSQAAVSFVSADPDECAYLFTVRSQHACAGVEPHAPGSVGPGGVFAIIFFIAIAVYFAGGVVYNRTVANARGWRQLPNYSLWAGIWSFLTDIFIIITSSCARFMPSRQGYSSLSISPNGRGMGRNREDENRLIDQLDEEWDD